MQQKCSESAQEWRIALYKSDHHHHHHQSHQVRCPRTDPGMPKTTRQWDMDLAGLQQCRSVYTSSTPAIHSKSHPCSPFVRILQGFLKVGQRRPLEDGGHQTAEVGADTAERQAKVHALSQQGVQSAPDASVQVCFQRG